MDDIVLQAIRKWPHVPACYGWLGLDSRGHWWMRDESAQQAGSFQAAFTAHGVLKAKGTVLKHDKLIEFIARNYAKDEVGRWFFQNGPQRVFVELAHTPWIFRISENGEVHSHTGQETFVIQAVSDEHGQLYLETPLGFGLVHSQDVVIATDFLLEWSLITIAEEKLQQQFNYLKSPQMNQMAT
jgi:hypothetical protein